MYKTINDPYSEIAYPINSKKGVQILKNYLNFSLLKTSKPLLGGGVEKEEAHEGTHVLGPQEWECKWTSYGGGKVDCQETSKLVKGGPDQTIMAKLASALTQAAIEKAKRESTEAALLRNELHISRLSREVKLLEGQHQSDVKHHDEDLETIAGAKADAKQANEAVASEHKKAQAANARADAEHSKAEADHQIAVQATEEAATAHAAAVAAGDMAKAAELKTIQMEAERNQANAQAEAESMKVIAAEAAVKTAKAHEASEVAAANTRANSAEMSARHAKENLQEARDKLHQEGIEIAKLHQAATASAEQATKDHAEAEKAAAAAREQIEAAVGEAAKASARAEHAETLKQL